MSARAARARWNARRASACRPDRYKADIRRAQRRSRRGSSRTIISRGATSSRLRPHTSSASARSSSTHRWYSCNRAASRWAGGHWSRSCSGGPRQSATAADSAAAASSQSLLRAWARPSRASRSKRLTSTESPGAVSAYPPGQVRMTVAPSTFRSRRTMLCTTFRADGGGRSPQTASIRRSVVTTSPAPMMRAANAARSRAPAIGLEPSAPVTSSGPSTANSIVTRR
jgi:hypothetical protein